MSGKYKHITYEQRKQIEKMYNAGTRVQEIADRIGISRGSVYKELKRGKIDGVYQAQKSQKRYEGNLEKKGREPIIIENQDLRDFIRRKVLEEGWSPQRIAAELRKEENSGLGNVSRQTIYTAIERGYIPDVTLEDIRNNCATIQKDKTLYLPTWFLKAYQVEPGQKFELSVKNKKIVLERLED